MKKRIAMMNKKQQDGGFGRPQTPKRENRGDSSDSDDELLTTPIQKIFRISPKSSNRQQAEVDQEPPPLEQPEKQDPEGRSECVREGVTRIEMAVEGRQYYEGLVTNFDRRSGHEMYTVIYDEDGEKEKLSAHEVRGMLLIPQTQNQGQVGATASRKIKIGESRICKKFEVIKDWKGTVQSYHGNGDYKVLWDADPNAIFKPILPLTVLSGKLIEAHIIEDETSSSEEDTENLFLPLDECICNENHRIPQLQNQRKKRGRITEKLEVAWEGKEDCGVCLLPDFQRKVLIVHGILPKAGPQVIGKLSPGDLILEINESTEPEAEKDIFENSEKGTELVVRLERGKQKKVKQRKKKKPVYLDADSEDDRWPWEKIQNFSTDFVWYKSFPCRRADISEASTARLSWPFPQGQVLVQYLEERRQYALAKEEDLLPFDEGEVEEGRKGLCWSAKLSEQGFNKYKKKIYKSQKGHSYYSRPMWDKLMANAQKMLQDALVNDHNATIAASTNIKNTSPNSPVQHKEKNSRKRSRSEYSGRGRMSLLKTKQKLRPGDVVAYYDKVSSAKMEGSIATVQKGQNPYILLANGNRLESDDQLQKLKGYSRGRLVTEKKGAMLSLDQYILEADAPKGVIVSSSGDKKLFSKMQENIIQATKEEFPDMPVSELFWGKSKKKKKTESTPVKGEKTSKLGEFPKKGKTQGNSNNSSSKRMKKENKSTKQPKNKQKVDVFKQLQQKLKEMKGCKEEMPFPMSAF